MTFDEQLQVDRAQRDSSALDIAVDGLRELEDHWGQAWADALKSEDQIDQDRADVYQLITEDLSRLLDKIGAAR